MTRGEAGTVARGQTGSSDRVTLQLHDACSKATAKAAAASAAKAADKDDTAATGSSAVLRETVFIVRICQISDQPLKRDLEIVAAAHSHTSAGECMVGRGMQRAVL